jgi:small subunit ribosomal protein S6
VRKRNYELMYIIDPNVGGDEEYARIMENVATSITKAGAIPSDDEVIGPTGRRKLAYTIRHNGQDLNEGFYAIVRFSAQPQQIGQIERDLKLNEPIVRYLLTLVEA